MYAHISPGCNGSGLIQEAKDLDFRILQGSHHRWVLCDTDISLLRQINTVIGKYSVQWERNTLYCEREILYTVIGKYSIQWERNTSYCKREILCTVREKYFIPPPPPNMSIWKAGSQKFSHHFYLGHSWEQLWTNNHKETWQRSIGPYQNPKYSQNYYKGATFNINQENVTLVTE